MYHHRIFKSIGMGSSAGLFATGIYGVVKVVMTALALAFMTEQLGRKWSLLIGALGQAFAMFYIGINQAVNPVTEGASLDGNSIFAIICVYLFVVFYSVGWGPIPFVLSAECSVSISFLNQPCNLAKTSTSRIMFAHSSWPRR